jgi:phosphopantothenoylcysteine decarboxylase/phosphopantothenate--cysteine ligase
MRILITAGPTREPIDTVRFISNRSSGQMGSALAQAMAEQFAAEVCVLLGPVESAVHHAVSRVAQVRSFETVDDLQTLLVEEFAACDVLIMAAAVGDFRVAQIAQSKLSRSAGPREVTLVPTDDLLAGVAATKRDDQCVVSFAVEDGPAEAIEAKARAELAAKHADMVVVNTPAAMGAEGSQACVLSAGETLLPWAQRTKAQLAAELASLLSTRFDPDAN